MEKIILINVILNAKNVFKIQISVLNVIKELIEIKNRHSVLAK